MALRIVWSVPAHNDKEEILTYWTNRNKSSLFSKKLNQLFKQAVLRIAEHPFIGHITNRKHTRIKIVRDYLIVYEVSKTEITILAIWDGRRNPALLQKMITREL